MFTCKNCKHTLLVGQGWNPPPCLLKSSNEIIESEDENSKCFFNPVICRCGQKIGIKVMSGLANQVGYWQVFREKSEDKMNSQNDIFYQVAKKNIFEKNFRNKITMAIQQQSENKVILTVVKKFINVIFHKPQRNDQQKQLKV